MLDSMRTLQNTWIGKAAMALIFVLIIVGLSFFGFADLFRSTTSNWAASVGGTEISADTFRQAYQTDLQRMQQQMRRPLTNAQARQLGIDQRVMMGLVVDALFSHQAAQLGLAVSDPQIAKIITQDPTFAGQNGQFDPTRFASLLRDNGLTEQGFVREQRATYLRQELRDGIAGAITAPKAAVEALHRFQAETRSIDLVVLQPSLVSDVAAPDEATLQAYYDGHKPQFMAPEYRKVTLLVVTPADVAKPDAVTAEDIQKAYDAAPEARFGAPERRTVQQIVFPTRAEAEAAALRIAAGTAFAAVAAERKVSGRDLELGRVTRAQIFDKAVADAAFALPAGGTSEPITGTFGAVLVHVADVTPGTRKPLAEVEPVLRKEIAEQPARTRDALRAIRDKVEDQRSAGKTLAETAAATGLSVRTINAVDAGGRDKAGAAVDVPDREQVLRAVFASDVGVDNDVVQTRTGDQIWFEVAHVDPAHQQAFAEVKPAVEAAWRSDEVAKRLSAKADDLVKMLQTGSTMEQVSAAAGNAEIKHVGDLRRAGTADIAPPVVQKAFDTPVGTAGTAEGEGGSRVVFKVLDSIVPPLDPEAPAAKEDAQRYQGQLADEVMQTYLTQVQDKVGVKINPAVVNGILGGSS